MSSKTAKEFAEDVNVDLRLVGSPVLLSPFLQCISSQRSLMLSSNEPQVMVLDGAEVAKIQTGFESKYGKYEFDGSMRDQDIQILEVIPKFRIDMNNRVRSNPKVTVIYLGADDNKIGCFDVDAYTALYSGFGYINKRLNHHLLQKGQFVSADTKFQTSPNHDDELYKMGVNAKVCYLPMWEATNDAFVISDRLQKKCEHTVIDSVTLEIHPDDIPLNLYGDDDQYRCIPDIGEKIRDDGIIMGFRTLNKSSFLSDMTAEELKNPEYLHDELHVAPAGAEVIDIEIFTNHKKYPELCTGIYSQLMKYQDQYHNYWAAIIDTYEKYHKEGYECRPEFNNLVTKCKGWCYTRGGKQMILMNKKEPVDFIHLKITYTYTRKISKGYKLTGRDGAKGVISGVWPLEDMPKFADGTTADIMISGDSPFNRLNGGQYYEQGINAAGELVQKYLNENTWISEYTSRKQYFENEIHNEYEYCIEFLNTVKPTYARLIYDQTKNMQEAFVNEVKENGFFWVIPPFSKSIDPDVFLKLSNKFGLEVHPVTYNAHNYQDGTVRKVTTYTTHLIGDKYLYLLGKIPRDQINAIEFGYVSQLMTPIKPTSKSLKTQSLFGQTPNRYGEDEIAIMTMSLGPATTARFAGIYSNSPVAQQELQRLLLTSDKPTALRNIGMTTKEVIESSSNISIFKHQLAAIGFEIKEVPNQEENK